MQITNPTRERGLQRRASLARRVSVLQPFDCESVCIVSEQLVFQSRPSTRPNSWQAISLPELGVEQQVLQLGVWLTELGESVVAGDPIVEVIVKGIVFDVEAPTSGTLRRCELLDGDQVAVGDVLGWIEPDREPSA